MSPQAQQQQVEWDDDKTQGASPSAVTWDDDSTAAKSTAKAAPTASSSGSVVGGFLTRAGETAKGMWDLATEPPQGPMEAALPIGARQVYRMGKGLVEGEEEAGVEAGHQLAQGKYGRAALTALGLSPGSVGTTTKTNELLDEGKYRTALGSGAFDTLMAVVGSKTGEDAPAAAIGRKGMARLTGAIGETGETASNLKTVLPDIVDTVKQTGKQPETVGDLRQAVQSTTDRFEQEFNSAMQPVRYKQVVPSKVANDLLSKITPNMAKTAAGQAEEAAIRDAALEFQKPWTINELNAERATRNAELQGFYNKGSGGQTAAMKSRVNVLIDKTVRDAAADIVYDEIGRANPKLDVRALKMKERSLWFLRDQMDARIGELQDKQLAREGRSAWEKVHVGTYASVGRMHGYLSGLSELVPGGGPEKFANAKVLKTFRGPGSAGAAARAAVLAMPLARLGGDESKKRKLTPPPPVSQ